MEPLGLPLCAVHQEAARAALPAAAYEFYAGGSGDEVSLAEAVGAWHRFRLRPRVLRDVATVDLATTVAGTPVPTPFLVAPTAFQVLAAPEGERATARGAAAAGSLLVLSTRSSVRLEQVAEAAGPWWFQVYVLRDRSLTAALVDRAVAAGARALVLTGDTPYVGAKRRSAATPVADDAYLVNVRGHLAATADPREVTGQDPSVTLEAVGWLAERSGLPVLVKGVLRADDAADCVAAGAAGVIVSNHGGRQLDRSMATAQALPEVVDAVGGLAEVYVDGGIRDGVSALTALALGARAVLIGRPVLWALAAGGADGVTELLRALHEDLRLAMGLAGVRRPAELDRSFVVSTEMRPPELSGR